MVPTSSVRSCPACGRALSLSRVPGASVGTCPDARHGSWFPATVLEDVLSLIPRRTGTSPPRFREAAIASVGPGAGRCPEGHGELRRALWGDAAFERCDTCHGLWLGADALGNIVEELRGTRLASKPFDPDESILMTLLDLL